MCAVTLDVIVERYYNVIKIWLKVVELMTELKEKEVIQTGKTDASPKEKQQTIHSIERALDIIEFLYKNGDEASIREISSATGLFGSTIHRILSTLKLRGYIHQNEKNSKYWLGSKFYGLGNAVKDNMPLAEIVEPYADEIAKKYRETIYTAIPYYQSTLPQQVIVSKVSYSPFIIKNSPEVGSISFSHGAATGKCMMAYYSDKLLEEYRKHPLPPLTHKTITEWPVMDEELRRIRFNGYAMESEEEEVGTTCLAVPILDNKGNLIASISLSGPTAMVFEYKINDILADLKDAASKIASHFC